MVSRYTTLVPIPVVAHWTSLWLWGGQPALACEGSACHRIGERNFSVATVLIWRCLSSATRSKVSTSLLRSLFHLSVTHMYCTRGCTTWLATDLDLGSSHFDRLIWPHSTVKRLDWDHPIKFVSCMRRAVERRAKFPVPIAPLIVFQSPLFYAKFLSVFFFCFQLSTLTRCLCVMFLSICNMRPVTCIFFWLIVTDMFYLLRPLNSSFFTFIVYLFLASFSDRHFFIVVFLVSLSSCTFCLEILNLIVLFWFCRWSRTELNVLFAAMRIQLSDSIHDSLVKYEPKFKFTMRGLRNVLVSIKYNMFVILFIKNNMFVIHLTVIIQSWTQICSVVAI